MRKLSNKKIIILSIVGTLVSLSIAFTYAIWSRSFTQTGINTNDYSCFDIKYSENTSGLTLSKKYPIIDEEGLNQESYDVTIQNVCNIGASYTVLLNKKSTSTLADEHVKVAVNGNINLLSDYQTTTTSISNYSDARVIYTDFLSANETKTIKIQSWMDENTSKEDGSNKSFTYKITIDAQTSKNLLADKILENKVITSTPDFSKGEPLASETNTGSGLYKTEDDDGTSYYFRGAIDNNYVSFANQLWRIVRINGDGSIRLIKSESIGASKFNEQAELSKYAGFTYDNASACTKSSPCISSFNSSSSTFSNNKTVTSSTIKSTLENWYKNNLASYDSKIALSSFCNDTSYTVVEDGYSYGARNRTVSSISSLKCPDTSETYGGYYKLKIGLLNVDESNFAGLAFADAQSTNYIYHSLSNGWYTMSPGSWSDDKSYLFFNFQGQYVIAEKITSERGVYPVINLNSNVDITGGNGTESNPFVVK